MTTNEGGNHDEPFWPDALIDYSIEAIPERDPTYELPEDDGTISKEVANVDSSVTLSPEDAHHWASMVRLRPELPRLIGLETSRVLKRIPANRRGKYGI